MCLRVIYQCLCVLSLEAFVSKGGVLLKCDAIHATSGVARLTDGHLEDIHTNRQTSTHTHTCTETEAHTNTHKQAHIHTKKPQTNHKPNGRHIIKHKHTNIQTNPKAPIRKSHPNHDTVA